MSRRDRLERKLEKREEWADGRRAKAAERFSQADPYRGDVAFNTQPGHIPERARVIRATEKGFEHAQMAAHHDSKAAGLAAQLERSVFADDADAVEQLEVRIAERVALVERAKAINRHVRSGEALEPPLTEAEARELASLAHAWGSVYKPGYPPYHFTNLSASIRRDRQRLTQIQQQQQRTQAAAAAPSGVTIEGNGYVRITFAEKPPRETLNALRAAGFRWGGGSWVGERAKIPTEVQP